jgi:hypothetical protein
VNTPKTAKLLMLALQSGIVQVKQQCGTLSIPEEKLAAFNVQVGKIQSN